MTRIDGLWPIKSIDFQIEYAVDVPPEHRERVLRDCLRAYLEQAQETSAAKPPLALQVQDAQGTPVKAPSTRPPRRVKEADLMEVEGRMRNTIESIVSHVAEHGQTTGPDLLKHGVVSYATLRRFIMEPRRRRILAKFVQCDETPEGIVLRPLGTGLDAYVGSGDGSG